MGWILGAVLRRYWIESSQLHEPSRQVTFTGDTFHHIFDVCRQSVGSKFEVLTEQSKAYFVEVTEHTKKNALAKILEERIIPPLPQPHIHLALSISRFPVMDAVMEKAVEMGVKSVVPFFSEHSFVRSNERISENKLERWDKIVKSATQQSGRGDLMKIYAPIKFSDLSAQINLNHENKGLFAYEGEATQSIKAYLESMRAKPEQNTASRPAQGPGEIKNLWLVVGSEGGFSYKEVDELKAKGLEPVTVGSQILRVETACIALVSVLKYEFDLMR